jgi:hypothetical protein
MVPWDSAPVSHSFRQRHRQALGKFFLAFQKDDPRWVSLLKPINHDDKTYLYYNAVALFFAKIIRSILFKQILVHFLAWNEDVFKVL